jgi:NADH:ubiquinone oxidoreductase subunit
MVRPMATFGTWLHTRLRGRAVGTDSFGNRYFQGRARGPEGRASRWVVYAGPDDASTVPAEWWGWLHHTADAPLPTAGRRVWQREFEPNLTGTPVSYRPPGHDYAGGIRPRAPGDYEAWSPDGDLHGGSPGGDLPVGTAQG